MDDRIGFTDAELVALLPKLRTYALKLCKNGDAANDLVQYTVERMLLYKSSFVAGHLLAWGFTILRGKFISDYRVAARGWMTSLTVINNDDGDAYDRYPALAPYDDVAAFEAREALELMFSDPRLNPMQKQAVLLVCMDGMSMEEAGEAMGVPSGTIKSRVNRAREILKEYA